MKKSLQQALANCSTEEEVKFAFIQFFRAHLPKTFKLDSRKNIDFYTPQILFEFKFDVDLKNIEVRARAFAQALYYIRRLKYGIDFRVPSRFIAAVDKKSAAILNADSLSTYFVDDRYDWDRAPSTPDKTLISDLALEPIVQCCRVFDFADRQDAAQFVEYIKRIYLQEQTFDAVKKEINENNFYAIFAHWNEDFRESVENSHKTAEYFLTDIEDGKSNEVGLRRVQFLLSDGSEQEKVMPIDSYKYFWSVHEKVSDAGTMKMIRQKMDRMTALDFRRFTGEFFTPIEHAQKALEYIERVVGRQWWRTGEYRLWDPAAGTGNLEFMMPQEALKYCYISTLLNDDAAYCRSLYPTATVFQYDYLNDGEEKLPSKLRADMADPDIKWIIFVNPPYVTANNRERDKEKINKIAVSMTAIRKFMVDDGMGEVSRELSSQFLYRINRDFRGRRSILGLFAKIKYINAPYDQMLRDRFFDYKFEGGFMFPSKAFQGTKGQFPVGFLMWRLDEHIPLTKQRIRLDVFNERLGKIGEKNILSVSRGVLLNKWIDRPPCRGKFPPFSSALKIGRDNKDRRHRIANGFLASFYCGGNDFMHQNDTALLSGPYVSASGMSVTAANFERCLVVHAVRRLPRATWLNDRDQFLRPSKRLPTEFINDCVVWSLFAPSNNTAALSNVEYEGEIYQIRNNLYPWTRAEVSTWRCSKPELLYSMASDEDRFAACWLSAAELSTEARAVLESAKEIYRTFYAQLLELDCKKFKITTWDAGWYQIRHALEEARLLDDQTFRADFDRLGEKLLPQIYELGFLRDEVTYFD